MPARFSFFSVSLSLFLQYLQHPEIFVQHATDLMSLKTLFQKSKPTRKIKARSFGLFLSFQERGIPEKQQEKITKQKEMNRKKGRPRYALAVSQIVFVVPPGNPVERKMPGRARNSLMLVSKSANAPPQG